MYCDSEIDELKGPVPGGRGPDYMQRLAAWQDRLKHELAAAQRAAEEAEERAGLTAIRDHIAALCDRTEPLVDAIQGAVASSLAGCAVKILTAFAWSDGTDFLADYPHRIAVSVLRDALPHLPDDVAAIARRFVNADEGAKIDDALFAADAAGGAS